MNSIANPIEPKTESDTESVNSWATHLKFTKTQNGNTRKRERASQQRRLGRNIQKGVEIYLVFRFLAWIRRRKSHSQKQRRLKCFFFFFCFSERSRGGSGLFIREQIKILNQTFWDWGREKICRSLVVGWLCLGPTRLCLSLLVPFLLLQSLSLSLRLQLYLVCESSRQGIKYGSAMAI